MGGFAIAMAAALASLVWFTRPQNFRWIDAGTPTWEFDLGPSQAQKIETWIADRERRLAELQPANSSGALGAPV